MFFSLRIHTKYKNSTLAVKASIVETKVMSAGNETSLAETNPEIEARLQKLRDELARRLTSLLGVDVSPEEVPSFLFSFQDENILLMKPVETLATEILSDDQEQMRKETWCYKQPEQLYVSAFLQASLPYIVSRPSAFGYGSNLRPVPSLTLLHVMDVFSKVHPEFMDLAKKVFTAPVSWALKLDLLSSMIQNRGEDLLKSYTGEGSLPYDPTFQELEAMDPAKAVAIYQAFNKKFEELEKTGIQVIVDHGPNGEPIILSDVKDSLTIDGRKIPLERLSGDDHWGVSFSTPANPDDWAFVWSVLPKMRIGTSPSGNVAVLSTNLKEINLVRNFEPRGSMLWLELGEPVARHGYCGSIVVDETGAIVGFGIATSTWERGDASYPGPDWLLGWLHEAKEKLGETETNPNALRSSLY